MLQYFLYIAVPSCYVSTSCFGGPINSTIAFADCCENFGVSYDLDGRCLDCPSLSKYLQNLYKIMYVCILYYCSVFMCFNMIRHAYELNSIIKRLYKTCICIINAKQKQLGAVKKRRPTKVKSRVLSGI